MIRIFLGVIVGFVVWSIVWLGSEKTVGMIAPDWFGRHSLEAERALMEGKAYETAPLIAVANLVRSFLTSMIAGYMAALVAGEYRRSTLILGVLLIAVGVAVEYIFWNISPLWYHILFVLFLIPMTVFGGRMRRPS